MALVGYARTSTADQVAGLDAQIRDLTLAGCDVIYNEQVSSVGERPEFDSALASLNAGDVLIVTKLDRLARSVRNLCEIVDCIESKKAFLRIMAMNLDTATATGRLMLNVLGSVAQFEREMMLERQHEGIEKARAEGKYIGSKPKLADRVEEIAEMYEAGISLVDIARETGVNWQTIKRLLKAHGTFRARPMVFDADCRFPRRQMGEVTIPGAE